MTRDLNQIGFVGMGIMGKPMAANLLKKGFSVSIYNRTPSKCQSLVDSGAKHRTSLSELASESDVIITMLTDTMDVREVLLGVNGLAHSLKPGSLIIDMSTISPEETRNMAMELQSKGLEMLDAPVSGGDIGAQNGTLTIMVGGNKLQYERALPLFQAMGKTVTHVGTNGSGQSTKLCNQVLVGIHLMAVCECLALAKKEGLDLEKTIEVISGGAGSSWAFNQLGPRIIRGDLSPGFMVKLLVKDLKLIQKEMMTLPVPLPIISQVQQYFTSLLIQGMGDLGTQAIIRIYEQLCQIHIAPHTMGTTDSME